MRKKEEENLLNYTNNSRYFNKLRRKKELAKGQFCRYCAPFDGCNSIYRWKKDYKCWKRYRKTQWR